MTIATDWKPGKSSDAVTLTLPRGVALDYYQALTIALGMGGGKKNVKNVGKGSKNVGGGKGGGAKPGGKFGRR